MYVYMYVCIVIDVWMRVDVLASAAVHNTYCLLCVFVCGIRRCAVVLIVIVRLGCVSVKRACYVVLVKGC